MPQRDYRALSQMELESHPFPNVQHEFRIFIAEAVFDQINERADTTREVGGILVGEIYKDNGGPFIMVEAVIDALHAREGETELTITYATWEYVHHQMDSVHVGKQIVGWYHTHPGFGIFLSEQDEFIHRNFFEQPFQIALVYDPVSRDHGAFIWRDEGLWRVRRYWIGDAEHSWDGSRERLRQEFPAPEVPSEPDVSLVSQPVSPSEPPLNPFFQFTQSTLLALLIGALLLGGLVGLEFGRTQASIEARVQGAQEAVASLNVDLLGVLKDALSDESLGGRLDHWHTELSETIVSLEESAQTSPEINPALQELSKALDVVQQARDERRLAHEMLKRLENSSPTSPQRFEAVQQGLEMHQTAMQHALTFHGHGIALLYMEDAETAARNNDMQRAEQLLEIAIEFDPKREQEYKTRIQAFRPREWSIPLWDWFDE